MKLRILRNVGRFVLEGLHALHDLVEGNEIDADEAHAQQLLAAGVAEPIEDKAEGGRRKADNATPAAKKPAAKKPEQKATKDTKVEKPAAESPVPDDPAMAKPSAASDQPSA